MDYHQVETQILQAIFLRFSLKPIMAPTISKQIKFCDLLSALGGGSTGRLYPLTRQRKYGGVDLKNASIGKLNRYPLKRQNTNSWRCLRNWLQNFPTVKKHLDTHAKRTRIKDHMANIINQSGFSKPSRTSKRQWPDFRVRVDFQAVGIHKFQIVNALKPLR